VTGKVTERTPERARSRARLRGRALAFGLLAPLLSAGCSTTAPSASPSATGTTASAEDPAGQAVDPRQEASDRFHRGKAHALAGDSACAELEFEAALEGFRAAMRPGDPGDLTFAGHLWESVRLYESIPADEDEEGPGDRDQRDGLIALAPGTPSADEIAVARREVEEAGSSVTYDVPIEVNDAVLNAVAFYQFRTPKAFASALQRSGRYLPLMRSILREAGLPEDLVYVAMIESAFKAKAHSRAAAKGYWQFIAGTGKRYGLKTTRDLEERSDPVKSTRAAAAYLRDLYEMFGDWYLAMAAYNAGEGRVLRGLQRTGARTYWELREGSALHRETRDYVPFFIATTLIAKDPARFGFDVVPDPPLEFDVVEVPRPVELARVSRELGVSLETLRGLNGEVVGRNTPRGFPAYPLRVPKGAGPALSARLSSIPAAPEVYEQTVTVRKGDTLGRFAARYKVSVAEIQKANRLGTKTTIQVGQRLVVPTRVPPARVASPALAEAAETLVIAEQARGEVRALPSPSAAVVDAASLGPDVSVAPAPALSPAPQPSRVGIPAAGFTADAPAPARSGASGTGTAAARRATKTHTVRKGDTLYRIANRYGVSLEELRRANRIGKSSAIRPGQRLAVPESTGR
jgi:membrane-bound lytic murein transglycosylase D